MSAGLVRAQDADLHALVTSLINEPDGQVALAGRRLECDLQGDIVPIL